MKQSILRMCCAFLLLGIALALMVGVIAAISEPEPEVHAWTKVEFLCLGQQFVRLYAADGSLLEQMQSNEQGICSSSLLPEGDYYAACADGLASFSVGADGVLWGAGAALILEGNTVSFQAGRSGQLVIERRADTQWYEYVLWNEEYRGTEVLQCENGELLRCEFSSLPYGSYTLEENGEVVCNIVVSAKEPKIVLQIPSAEEK